MLTISHYRDKKFPVNLTNAVVTTKVNSELDLNSVTAGTKEDKSRPPIDFADNQSESVSLTINRVRSP